MHNDGHNNTLSIDCDGLRVPFGIKTSTFDYHDKIGSLLFSIVMIIIWLNILLLILFNYLLFLFLVYCLLKMLVFLFQIYLTIKQKYLQQNMLDIIRKIQHMVLFL